MQVTKTFQIWNQYIVDVVGFRVSGAAKNGPRNVRVVDVHLAAVDL